MPPSSFRAADPSPSDRPADPLRGRPGQAPVNAYARHYDLRWRRPEPICRSPNMAKTTPIATNHQ